ncbi:DNA mismatch repair protein MutS [Amycolatopsis sp. A1MSW2902]
MFRDLNLDHIVDAVLAGREEYDLSPVFRSPLTDRAEVRYRHDVMRDLRRDSVREPVEEFAERMRLMRKQLAVREKLHYEKQRQRWFLDAVGTYCDAVAAFGGQLADLELRSAGLRGLREFLAEYLGSAPYRGLVADTRRCREELAKIKYRVHIRGPRVDVSRSRGDADYTGEVEKVFARFKQGAVRDYRVRFPEDEQMDHVQAQVLDCVAKLFPEAFGLLHDYCAAHRGYLEATIARYDREVQFYLAYAQHMRRIGAAGLEFCYPELPADSRDLAAEDAFDLALAGKLVAEKVPVVRNSFRLTGEERVIVVSGPNNGGKTTFARMFGQLPYLASLGLPVPAASARLFLPDRVYSHFEREEHLATLRGKLDDELVRIREILTEATADSVLVMNESFSSTTLHDARFIGAKVLEAILRLRSRAVYVTFVDELSALDAAIVSMVGAVAADDPARRTYELARRPADGLAYAEAVAAAYRLTCDSLRRRIAR